MISWAFDWLFNSEPNIRPEVQRRIDRDIVLQDTRLTLLVELGREPTHREIWNEAP